jgi:hypothetical protein
MAATTMQPTNKELLSRLRADHPAIAFVVGDNFKWSHDRNELTIVSDGPELYMLHELAHALLNHKDFKLDIELLVQEREAWDFARTRLAPQYSLSFDDSLAEEALDTYRHWLYIRSLCPTCGSTGLQTKTSTYVCINCRCSWRPNDARQCALRRYRIT